MKGENIALKELAKENGHGEADAKTDDPKGTPRWGAGGGWGGGGGGWVVNVISGEM
jgi:hypothetical protein